MKYLTSVALIPDYADIFYLIMTYQNNTFLRFSCSVLQHH